MNTSVTTLPPYITERCKVIMFDGKCKFCNFWVRFIIKNDPHKLFKLASVQSAEGQQILKHFDMSSENIDSMLFIEGYQAYTKSTAALQIARQLNQPWRLLTILKIIPARLRDTIYDRIALNRYRIFGKYDHCTVPTTEHEDRFLNKKT